jgi:hypothetical protein
MIGVQIPESGRWVRKKCTQAFRGIATLAISDLQIISKED